MTEKKARKSRPRSISLAAERQRIIAAERALVPLGSERVAVDAECYGLIAQLITTYKIRKHEVLRKALRVGLRALVQYDHRSPTAEGQFGTWTFEGKPGDEETEELPKIEETTPASQEILRGHKPNGVIHDDLDPEALAVSQG